MKNTEYTPVLHFISSFQSSSYKHYKIQLSFLLFLIFYYFLHQKITFYKKFQNFIQRYLKNIFVTNFPLLMNSPKPLPPPPSPPSLTAIIY